MRAQRLRTSRRRAGNGGEDACDSTFGTPPLAGVAAETGEGAPDLHFWRHDHSNEGHIEDRSPLPLVRLCARVVVGAELRILVVNAGSTSLKLSVVAADGSSEPVDSIEDAPQDVVAVAHRVVHGGARFRDPVVVDDAVEEELRALV